VDPDLKIKTSKQERSTTDGSVDQSKLPRKKSLMGLNSSGCESPLVGAKTGQDILVNEDRSMIEKQLKAVLIEEGASEDSSDQTIYTISQDSDPLDLPTPNPEEPNFETKALVIYERVESISAANRRIMRRNKGPDAEEENFDINELPTHLN
jgi:hypothetical protein